MAETKSPLMAHLKIYFRGFLLLLVASVVVYFIVNNLNKFAQILLVLIGFGGVILVHEFGHFIVAKLSGIKVEAFSIGLPPILVGIRRTEAGYRIRILPEFFPKQGDESGDGLLSFTVAKKAKPGETEYRIGLVPFGGFVGLLGQHDTGADERPDDPRAFTNKPISARMATISAGVVMNVITAVVLFIIVFMIGIERAPAVVGGVMSGWPAADAGIQPGDRIIEIKNRKDPALAEVGIAAALAGKDEKIPVTVRHRDGSVEKLELIAEPLPDMGLKGFGIGAARALTIAAVTNEELLREKTGLLPGDVVSAVNGQKVDAHWQLEEIVEQTLAASVTLSAERTRPHPNATSLERKKMRLGAAQAVQTSIPLELIHTNVIEPTSEADLFHICSMVPRLRITAFFGPPTTLKGKIIGWLKKISIVKERPSGPTLQSGDIILAVGDVTLPTYLDLRKVTTEYKNKPLPIKVLRENKDGTEQLLTATVRPDSAYGSDRVVIGIAVCLNAEHPVVAKTIQARDGPSPLQIPSGATITKIDGITVSNFYDVIKLIRQRRGQCISIDYRLSNEITGAVALDIPEDNNFINVKSILAELLPFEPLTELYKASGPLSAVAMSYHATVLRITETYLTVKRLIEGNVSPKTLLGPVGIVAFSYKVVSEAGLTYYLFLLAWISVVLAVLNFLPLPVIDGGHMIMLFVEKIKGSPLSRRVQEVWTYSGLTLLVALALYVTGNDILRLILG